MFVAGSEVRRVLGAENRRPIAWILGIGMSLPFVVALVVGSFLPLERLAGPPATTRPCCSSSRSRSPSRRSP
jgi:hypothetical protein